jgi:hypothetical protein
MVGADVAGVAGGLLVRWADIDVTVTVERELAA